MEQKRKIKVRFMDYWSGFAPSGSSYLIKQILDRHFDVEVCEEADYVFFSANGESHWSVPDRAVKIFHTGENMTPDFNACDYAIGFDWMDFSDEIEALADAKLPVWVVGSGDPEQIIRELTALPTGEAWKDSVYNQ